MPENDLFGTVAPPANFPPAFARELQPRLAAMAAHGLDVGTSSWKYPGWCGKIYNEQRDTADFMVARMWLKPGRSYEEAVTKFHPYKEIQEINEEARRAVDEFLERAFRLSKRGYIYINNRLEGFAPGTIAEIIRRLIEQGRKYVLIT